MELFPAIDLRNGQAVRLRQGNYDDMQVYGADPVAVAKGFKEQGAANLHLVDLDGAKDGQPRHFELIRRIAELSGLFVQVGGGVRDENRVAAYLEAGAGRVIIGTAAVKNFLFLEEMVQKYGDRIAVGVDARDGNVAVGGWLEITDMDAFEFCKRLKGAGVRTVIYTDIARDGELMGANISAYRALSDIPGLNIIASGGISYEHELIALRNMGTYGAIIGKALYVKKLDLGQLIRISKGGNHVS